MGTAIKHPVADRVKQSFVASQCPDVKNTNDGLIRSGTGRLWDIPYGNSGRRRVN